MALHAMKEWIEIRLIGFFSGFIIGSFISIIFFLLSFVFHYHFGATKALINELIFGLLGMVFWRQSVTMVGKAAEAWIKLEKKYRK